MTRDGRADIATPTFSGLAVFAQDPGGRSFAPATVLSPGCGGTTVAIADINGDGRNDVVTGCGTTIAYYLGRPDGTLDAARSIAASVQNELVAGDFNDDGFDDVAVTVPRGQNIGIVYGQAGTTPRPVQWLSLVEEVLDRPPQLAVADLNGDGRDDLVVGSRASRTNVADHDKVRVFHQDAAGQLVGAQVIDSPSRQGLLDISLGDFNHDGAVDIGVEVSTIAFASHYQTTPGRFADQTRAALDCIADASGDFNGDGLIDLACRTGSTVQPAVGIIFGTRPDP